MNKLLLIAGCAALAACGQSEEAAPADNANVAAAEEANAAMADANADGANASGTALASINETSWEFVDPKSKKEVISSVDATGKYIDQTKTGNEHLDHGTAVMKDGKACFTSAMNTDGEVCWTDPMLAVGQSGETTSSKGETLTVKRVAYVPLTM